MEAFELLRSLFNDSFHINFFISSEASELFVYEKFSLPWLKNCAGKDCTVAVLDMETFKVRRHYKKAHKSSVYSLCYINQNLFASGDDDGLLRVWDVRKSKPCFEYQCGEETVNAIIVDDSARTLLVALNDGSLAAFNVSKHKLMVQVCSKFM